MRLDPTSPRTRARRAYPDGVAWIDVATLVPHPEAGRAPRGRLPFLFAVGRVGVAGEPVSERASAELDLVAEALVAAEPAIALETALLDYAVFVFRTTPTLAARLRGTAAAAFIEARDHTERAEAV